jgi:DNA repair protein RadD
VITLRPYQAEAVDSTYKFLRTRSDNPCIVIPTGGGKTPVIATICRDAAVQWHGRCLVIAHVKELLQQTSSALNAMCPEVPFGIYSAGLKRRDTDGKVIVAGIQSIYRRAAELGAFDLILIDEAHLIPTTGDGENEGMYRTFLADAKRINPNVRVIGLTATPYRLTSGMICGPDSILNDISYEVGVKELIVNGYLCPLTCKHGLARIDTSGLKTRGGDFIQSELEKLANDRCVVETAVEEIVERTASRRSVLAFCVGREHGRNVQRVFMDNHGIEAGYVDGETPDNERAKLIQEFKNQELKYLVNVNVLTTGFDAPGVDCVSLLRNTLSPGLYYQMVGRGFRLAPGKQDCLVLDFGGNSTLHGPVDAIKVKSRAGKGGGEAPGKECMKCHEVVAVGFSVCPACGEPFPVIDRGEPNHEGKPAEGGILSGEVTDVEYDVHEIRYSVHVKKGADESAPKSMRVDYITPMGRQSEYICVEHDGFARRKAVQWWNKMCALPVPDTAEQASSIANAGNLRDVNRITVRSISGQQFDQIVNHECGELPNFVDANGDPVDNFDGHLPIPTGWVQEEIPF